MKRILCALLAALLCLGLAAHAAELELSSFGGSGAEYRISIDDPEIVACTCEARQDGSEPEIEAPGSEYTLRYIFTGRKPGTTQMTVSMTSPLMEGSETRYTVTVDDALNVTLAPAREIARFELARHGEIAFDSYEIFMLEGEYRISVNDGAARKIGRAPVEALNRVVEKYDVLQWDGFQGFRDDVLDGEGFRLEIAFTDGTTVFAVGDNAFPEHYVDAVGEMQDILEGIQTTTVDRLRDFLSRLFPGG